MKLLLLWMKYTHKKKPIKGSNPHNNLPDQLIFSLRPFYKQIKGTQRRRNFETPDRISADTIKV